MPRFPKRPVLTWKEIAKIAKAFCDEHGLANREYPLDIEGIIEFDLDIEIRFCYGVHDDFGSPAQICPGNEMPIIIVDYDQYRANSPYYRYSLAHEIGHYILHKNWLNEVWKQVDSIETWKKIITEIPHEDYEWFEGQAEEFASFLLAPEAVFEPFIETQLKKLNETNRKLNPEDILPYLAVPVSKHFGMSNSAAQARIRKSGKWKEFCGNK